ncbi:MAG TPA: NUDIX domain-containing protein [Longimicrobium sp.]|nr:NUDIX domain-containing protein [Longimicrobium sp.]
MPKTSAGLLMYRRLPGGVEIFLVHPGGPFWARKDAGAWSIPKGEYVPGEDPLDAARREFTEETGIVPEGEFVELGVVKQAGGKIVTAWAFEGDCDPADIRSNNFTMEWPPRSGRQQEFPEVDRAEWFGLETASEKILKGQLPFLGRLADLLGSA